MFGIGLGELIVILLIAFLVSPRDLPKVVRKMGEAFAALQRIRNEAFNLRNDVTQIIRDRSDKAVPGEKPQASREIRDGKRG